MSEHVLIKNDVLPPFEPVNMASTTPSGLGEDYPIPPSVDPHNKPRLIPTEYEQTQENNYHLDQGRRISSMFNHTVGLGALLAFTGIVGGGAFHNAHEYLKHESTLHQQVRAESGFDDPSLIRSVEQGIITGVLIIAGVRVARGLYGETQQYMTRKAVHLEHRRRYS